MANYPFTREYYTPSLQSSDSSQEYILRGEQTPYYSEAYPQSNLFLTAAFGASLFGAGFLPWGKGRVWDKYVAGIRAIEEYSPSKILRTFQFSNFLTQFTSPVNEGIFIAPDLLKENRFYSEYLSKLIGTDVRNVRTKVLSEGVTLKGGKLFWGQSERVALPFASAFAGPEGAVAHIQSAYARTIGAGEAFPGKISSFLKAAQPFGEASLVQNPVINEMPITVIGGKTRLQHYRRMLGAWGTEQVSRFNRLLEAPMEMEPLKTVFKKVDPWIRKLPGFSGGLGVPEGPGLKMFGGLAWKYGAVMGGLYMGYQTLDYLTRETLDSTVFSEGITAGIATLGVKANLFASQIAEYTGLHRYREAQEEIAPGSTSLQKLLAFPLLGGMGVGFASYFSKVGKIAKLQWKENLPAHIARERIEEELGEFQGKGLLARLGRDLYTKEGLYRGQSWISKTIRKIAEPVSEGVLSYKGLGILSPNKLSALVGIGLGAALTLPFLPGALIPSKRPEELEAIYSGEQEVPIRKGRWWEFGRSAYEGGRIDRFQPHWYPRMLMRAREKGIWGEEEPSPISKWFQKEFTYDLERKFYEERPYPISSLPFEDIPLIGPLLANTIGILIKPPVLMHTEEWMTPKGTRAMPERYGQRIAREIGESPGGEPVTPYKIEGLVGEQAYRLTEMIGLPGFTMTSIKEAITGTPDLYDQMSQLESARRIAGFERFYWDMELGGLIGATESFRRLFPHRRRQIPLYNPIRNLMPEWLPGVGEKSPNFLVGDPFTKVPEGELRLPGIGYAQRFPELKDVAPENYPLIHKYKILQDIGMWSDKARQHRQMVKAARKLDTWTDYEEKIYQQTEEQIAQKKKKLQFQEYEYLSPTGEIFGQEQSKWGSEESSSVLATINKQIRDQEQEPGIFSKMFGGYWELLAHNAETAWDQLTPISPGAKLVHTRSAIESYERTQLFGTQNAFWSHPIRDFISPFMESMEASFGDRDVPTRIEHRRNLEEYFDILEYVKYSRLANIARFNNDKSAAKEFEKKKDETLFGINPFTRNYSSIFRALPRRDRDYFNAFAEVGTPEERAKILEMVPENEQGLYVARWKLALAEDIKKAKKQGILSEQQLEEADEMLENIYSEARSEGFPSSKELLAEYIETRQPGESYGDWYRRTKLLTQIENIPGPDWIGFHPSVDLDDIKLKVVQQLAEDVHDYDIWGDQVRALINKPYINDDAVKEILEPPELTSEEIRDRIGRLLAANNVNGDVFIRKSFGPVDQSSINIEIERDRSSKKEIL